MVRAEFPAMLFVLGLRLVLGRLLELLDLFCLVNLDV
eukprot:COSAG04_NODE_26849_length_290_cov_0.727749_1_plen_36_part_10